MSPNVGKLHAIIHLSQHEQHRNDILKTGFMVSVYGCVCVYIYLFYLLLCVCVCVCVCVCLCVCVIPFLPSVKVKHQSFNRQTCQLSDAVSCSQPANSTFGDLLCWILALNLHTAGCPSHHPSQWIVSRFNHVYLLCSECVTSCPHHFNRSISFCLPVRLHHESYINSFLFKRVPIISKS